MADIFLILVIVVASLIFLVSSLYFLIHYQHPDDRNTAYFSKIVILGAFFLAGFTILGLPLDVANNAGYAGTSFSS
jgi:LMBR1 domain-containing protein 1